MDRFFHSLSCFFFIVAVFFSVHAQDDPEYAVLEPNGGETYYIGDTMTIRIYSNENGNANVNLRIGRYPIGILSSMGFTGAINPSEDSVLYFHVPDTFYISGRDGTTPLSAVSDSCKINVGHYLMETTYYDNSDEYFSIKARSDQTESSDKGPCGSGALIALFIPLLFWNRRRPLEKQ